MSAATCSPRRSRNRLRPLTTLSPFSVEEITPRNCAVTNGSRTTVSRLLAGLVAPSRRVARSAASLAALSRSNPPGWRATLKPKPGLRLVAVVGEAADADVAAVLPAALADAGGRRHGDLAPGVGVVGVVDADPGIGGERQPLELLGQLDLALRRERRPASSFHSGCSVRGDAVGLGQPGPLVDGAEGDVVARLGEDLVDGARIERAGVGEAGAAVADDAHADALALGRHEVLDLAVVDAHLGLAAAGDVRLDLLAGLGLGDDLVGERLQLASFMPPSRRW